MRLDKLEILRLVEEGFIMVNTHPDLPLQILNYTRKTQFEKAWNEYTLLSRGLVIDGEFNIIAIPFKKFFNFEEHSTNDIPNEPYEIFDKMDGSLGILFHYANQWHIATRGSFVSDQAIRAKSILKKYNISNLNPENTYLFEIIYPENRIVVNYGKDEKLVLLGIICSITGHDYTYAQMQHHVKVRNIDIPLVKRHEIVTGIMGLKERNILNEEGYVLRFYPSNFRMKVKFQDYCRLHSIITKISTKDIWMFLRDGKDLNELLDHTPDEFDEWVKEQVDKLRKDYNIIETQTRITFNEIYSALETKREFAEKALKIGKGSSILFKMYDKKPYDHIIWKMIEPKWSKPFFKDDEE